MRISRNVREYTVGERQFLLYKYLLTHASTNGVITYTQIMDYLLDCEIKITDNTLYNDLNVLKNVERFLILLALRANMKCFLYSIKFQEHS